MANTKRNWPEILKEIDESGLTLREYSELSEIPYSTLCSHWRKTGKQPSAPVIQGKTETLTFVRIDAGERETCRSGVRIRVGNMFIEVDESFNKSVLADVLEVVHACA